jgi:chaperonin GroES
MISMMNPCNDFILIKPIVKDKTNSGIIVQDEGNQTPEIGEVLAVGPGKLLETGERLPMDVNVGDKVFIQRYKVHQIKHEEEELIFATSNDILAIL